MVFGGMRETGIGKRTLTGARDNEMRAGGGIGNACFGASCSGLNKRSKSLRVRK